MLYILLLSLYICYYPLIGIFYNIYENRRFIFVLFINKMLGFREKTILILVLLTSESKELIVFFFFFNTRLHSFFYRNKWYMGKTKPTTN